MTSSTDCPDDCPDDSQDDDNDCIEVIQISTSDVADSTPDSTHNMSFVNLSPVCIYNDLLCNELRSSDI